MLDVCEFDIRSLEELKALDEFRKALRHLDVLKILEEFGDVDDLRQAVETIDKTLETT